MAKDQIPGGKADNVPHSAFDPKQLAMGKKVEMEHTSDPALAEEIASDHLEEFDQYYSALQAMESKLKQHKNAAYCVGVDAALKPFIARRAA